MNTPEPSAGGLSPTAPTQRDPLATAVREQQQRRAEARQQLEHDLRPANLGRWSNAPRSEHRRHLQAMTRLRHADLLGPLQLNDDQNGATEAGAQGVWIVGGPPGLLLPRPDGQAVLLARRRGALVQVTRTGQHAVTSAADLDLDAGHPEIQPFTRPGFLAHDENAFKPTLDSSYRPWLDENGDQAMGILLLSMLVTAGIGALIGAGLSWTVGVIFHPHHPLPGIWIAGSSLLSLCLLMTWLLLWTRKQFYRRVKVQQEQLTPLLLAPGTGTMARSSALPASQPSSDPRF